MNLSKTNVVSIVEQAIQKILCNALPEMADAIFISDTNSPKPEMPYIELHGVEAQDMISGPSGPQGQGTGIFKVPFTILYRSHAKPESAADRQAVVDAINYFAYGNPVELLNQQDGLFVYGFIPEATGNMQVNTDLKAFEYLTTWTIICIPQSND